jgi:myo-inositol catabolism protein IolS
MRYRRLGGTGLEVSVIGLGTWQFSGEWGKDFTQPEVDVLLRRAGELGINLIDTAECYGDHLAESLVGRAIAADRDRCVIATKFGHRFHAERMQQAGWDPGSLRSDHWSPEEVVRQLEASLRALGTDYVDVHQSHGGTDADVETPGLWEALEAQVRAGKIRHLGLSIDAGDAARARKAPEVGAEVVQVPYSRLQRDAEPEVLPACAELGIGVLAREPLANGYLSGKYGPERRITDPGDWRSAHDAREVDEKLAAVEQIQRTELPEGVPLAQWALTWSLRNPAVAAVIPGSKTLSQLDSNAAAADLDLVLEAHPRAVAR